MWNECFSSNCFLALTVSWCEVKVWERWGEERRSTELLNPERLIPGNKKDGNSSRLRAAGIAVVEPWANVWDFRDFLLWVPCVSPLSSCSAPGAVPTLQNEPRVSHSVSVRHQVQLQPVLHMQEMGILWGYCWLYLFSFPVWIFSYVLCTKPSPPSAENFSLKQILN